ncbi:hypothetical protein M3626_16470, partial [Psychrobacillus sp. MER TA 17]|nr:hypothetical protein [Psychrobacillus sp. MER TA 17]
RVSTIPPSRVGKGDGGAWLAGVGPQSEENGGPCPPSFTEIPIHPNKGESRSSQISTPLLHFKGFWDNLFYM